MLARGLLLPMQTRKTMKIRITPIKTIALLSAAVCTLMFAFSPNAKALDFGDEHVVGTVSPAAPASAQNEADYINFMITLGLGQTVVHDFGQPEGVQTISRSTNVFANLPTANPAGAITNNSPVNDNGVVHIDLGAVGTYSYLFAKYDGQNDNSVVWYVGDLGGMITIPFDGPLGHALSHYTLFLAGGGQVPDGGTTAMLLGTALGALGMARRFLKK
jgi:VPDSG-CTERM motif